MKVKFSAIIEVGAAMAAVTRNGDALRYVKDQTEPVVMAAVTRNGYALQYVLNLELFVKVAAIFGIEI